MHKLPKEYYAEGFHLMGYSWKAQAEFGTVYIDEKELFDRIEFGHFPDHEHKVAYAMDMGWRFNIDNQKWYRLRGL